MYLPSTAYLKEHLKKLLGLRELIGEPAGGELYRQR